MVTTIDPVVHGGRNRRYWLAIGLHVLGAAAAAAALGALLGGAGALLGGPWRVAGPVAIAAIAALYALRELVGVPVPLPDRHRQVPEWWRTFYSPPFASLLYGLGLGVGFLTFLTFGTFVAVAAGAVVSAGPGEGALICAPFGLARGLSVVLASRRGGIETLNALERVGATRDPRIVNGAALVLVATGAVLCLAESRSCF